MNKLLKLNKTKINQYVNLLNTNLKDFGANYQEAERGQYQEDIVVTLLEEETRLYLTYPDNVRDILTIIKHTQEEIGI